MRNLPIGITVPSGALSRAELSLSIKLIEELGFDILGAGEHILFRTPTSNAFTTMAFAAAITTRIELLTAITLVPLYAPAVFAKLSAAVDCLSDGRLNVGVGIGGEFEAEFLACGVPLNERGKRTNEALEVARRLWLGDPVNYKGQFSELRDAQLLPPPVRRPPIWVAGRREASIRRTVAFGDVWFPYLVDAKQLAEGKKQLLAIAEGAGRSPQELRVIPYCYINVDSDAAAAQETAMATTTATYGNKVNQGVNKYLISGDIEHCVDRLMEFRAAGADGFMLRLTSPPTQFAKMASLLAERLVPQLRKRLHSTNP